MTLEADSGYTMARELRGLADQLEKQANMVLVARDLLPFDKAIEEISA